MSKNVGSPICYPNIWAPFELSVLSACFCILIAFIAIFGNGLIIIATIKDPLKKLKTPFNYFLVNLAIADLLLGSVSMPISGYVHYKESVGELHPLSNNLLRMTYFISGMASILSLITLSLDRYIAVSRAIKYRIYFKLKHCILITVVIWSFSIGFPFIYFTIGAVQYYFLFSCTAILTGFFVSVFVYSRVYVLLRRQSRVIASRLPRSTNVDFQLRRVLQEKKIARTFLVILSMFMILYLPAVVMTFLLQLSSAFDCVSRHWMRDWQSILISANSCVNPIICIVRLQTFNRSVKILLKCGCRRRSLRLFSKSSRRIVPLSNDIRTGNSDTANQCTASTRTIE